MSKLLATANLKMVFTADRKINGILRSVNDKTTLEAKGVYDTFVGQTSRSTRLREHRRAEDQEQSPSSLFQHFEQTAHLIDFDGMKFLAAVSQFTPPTSRRERRDKRWPDHRPRDNKYRQRWPRRTHPCGRPSQAPVYLLNRD
jgi:hypothetical protein